jgi:hypothetical protein
MNTDAEIIAGLEKHLALCRELLALAEQENRALTESDSAKSFAFFQTRKSLLLRLNESLAALRQHRQLREGEPRDKPALCPEARRLLRQNQDGIMKILLLDRENEQILLRRGMVPAKHIPPTARLKPHFVSELYRRNTSC